MLERLRCHVVGHVWRSTYVTTIRPGQIIAAERGVTVRLHGRLLYESVCTRCGKRYLGEPLEEVA